ncbi:MAG: alpha/beta hydrolase [Candidatus Micrarchaeota archaeon]|nr:alpha/beta hydrolase [Candidatus Micrarchaeota archaeon]
MKTRAFIIHCWDGKPNTRWYPWLKNELERRGFDVHVPAMPNTKHPRMGPWVKYLQKLVGKPDKNCYFIGHSVGCITILRYLESIDVKVGGTILVAGYTSNLGYYDLEDFFLRPIEWNSIKSHCRKFVAINSDNDPYVSLHYGYIFKEKLKAKLIVEHGKYHFSTKGNITRLPSALKSVLSLAT